MNTRISSSRLRKLITLSKTIIKVPTLIPPAVLIEPPPMNISNMVTRVEASFICAKSRLLKPDERGTVAWNHAFKAWSPKLIGAKVRGLFDSIAHKRTKAIRFKPAMVDIHGTRYTVHGKKS